MPHKLAKAVFLLGEMRRAKTRKGRKSMGGRLRLDYNIEGLCPLCVALFKELCEIEGRKNPELCEIYEDYVTGQAKTDNPEAPLLYAIKVAGQDAFDKADRALRARRIVG